MDYREAYAIQTNGDFKLGVCPTDTPYEIGTHKTISGQSCPTTNATRNRNSNFNCFDPFWNSAFPFLLATGIKTDPILGSDKR